MTEEIVIENPRSSSNIVVTGGPWGIEVTLDPMERPVERIDVYAREVDEFVKAIQRAAEEVRHD